MKAMLGVITLVIAIGIKEVPAQPANSNAHATAVGDRATTASAVGKQTLEIDIKGMSCMACVAQVKKTLSGMDGIKDVEVSLVPGSAKITALSSRVTTASVVQAINNAGYKASPKAPVK